MANSTPHSHWVKRSTRLSRQPVSYAEVDSEDESHNKARSNADHKVVKAPKKPMIRPVASARCARGHSQKTSTFQGNHSDLGMTSDDEDVESESDTDDEPPTKRRTSRGVIKPRTNPHRGSTIRRRPASQPATPPSAKPRAKRSQSPVWIPLAQNPNRYELTAHKRYIPLAENPNRYEPYRSVKPRDRNVPQPWVPGSSSSSLAYEDSSEDEFDSDFDDDGDDDDEEVGYGTTRSSAPYYSIMDPRNPESPKNFVSCMAGLRPDDESDEERAPRRRKRVRGEGAVDEEFDDESESSESDSSEYMDDDYDDDGDVEMEDV